MTEVLLKLRWPDKGRLLLVTTQIELQVNNLMH